MMRITLGLVIALAAATPAAAQTPTRVGSLNIQNSLAEIASNGANAQAAARANLGLAGAPLTVPVSPLLGGTTGALVPVTIGSGLSSAAGSLSVLYGTTTGTAAAGNDSRIVGALPASSVPNANLLGGTGGGVTGVSVGPGLALGGGVLSAAVTSVAGRTGAVTLGGGDITSALGYTPLSAAGGTVSGALSLTGAGTGLSVLNSATFGGANATNLTISSDATSITLQANSGSQGQINYNSKNGKQHVFNNQVQASTFRTPGNTVTLSGSTIPTPMGQFAANLTGSSTVTGNTSLSLVTLGAASDTAQTPNGVFDYLLIASNVGAGWSGGRVGAMVQLQTTAATTLSARSDGLVGYGAKVIGKHNAGGTSSAPLGVLFGANPWASLATGGTYWAGVVGEEVDASIQTGASADYFSIQQLVLTSDHATQGTNSDVGVMLAAQVGASAGLRDGYIIGYRGGQWPIDANGYLLRVQRGNNDELVPATAAGGFDLNAPNFTGSGIVGGGFAWRSPGMQIRSTGAVQAGYGVIDGSSGGLAIDVAYQQLSGTPTVSAGGIGWTTGDLAGDASGNIVRVTAPAGVVTSVTVVRRGWARAGAVPSNPVTFNALNGTGGTGSGTGLTLTLAWDAQTRLALNPSGGPIVLPILTNAANDSAAAAAGVAVGQLYRNGSVVMQRGT